MSYCATIKKFFRPQLTLVGKIWVGEYFRYGIYYTANYPGGLSAEEAERRFNKLLIREYKMWTLTK